MWPTSRILAVAGIATMLGTAIGGWFLFIGMLLQQLALPSQPSVGFAAYFGAIGAIVGFFIGLAASAGAVLALYAIRRLPLRAPARAGLVAVVATCAALLPLSMLGPLSQITTTVTLCVTVAVLAFAGIWLCERHQLRARMPRPVLETRPAASGA